MHNSIEFQNAQGNPVKTPPSPELYDAAWNHIFVSNDGSKGVHNPVYSVQLLQRSYKKITGNDVPNAKML